METKFRAYRDLVRGMTQEDRALLVKACIAESREQTAVKLQYDWNAAESSFDEAQRKAMIWLTGAVPS